MGSNGEGYEVLIGVWEPLGVLLLLLLLLVLLGWWLLSSGRALHVTCDPQG